MAHHLLLADDSVTIQRVIKLTFADEDVDVVTVGDGNQAVAAIEKAPPDIVLADVAMPGRSGYEVAQHIRTTPHLAHIPVVLLTGAFEPVDEARASQVGCDGVLAKPFEPELVVNRVRELLARPRTSPPPVEVSSSAARESGMGSRSKPAEVDAYFDRLDQAFAARAASPRPVPPAAPETVDPAFDKFKEIFIVPSAPEPVSAAAPAESPSPFVTVPPAPAPTPEPPSPSLVEAFEGLLGGASPAPAVESPVPTSAGAAGISSSVAPEISAPATPVDSPASLTDDQIERITDCVMERLTARVNAGTIADVVSQVAERLVRQEIDAIRRRL